MNKDVDTRNECPALELETARFTYKSAGGTGTISCQPRNPHNPFQDSHCNAPAECALPKGEDNTCAGKISDGLKGLVRYLRSLG